jgi:hypothetical protein
MNKWKLVLAALCVSTAAHAVAIGPTAINGAPGHVIWTAAINDTVSPPTQANIDGGNTSPFAAESTGVLSVSNLQSCALRIQVWPAAGDTTNPVRFAVAVKAVTSTTGDTLTSAIWSRWTASALVASPDSSVHLITPITNARLGEFAVAFDSKAYLPSAFRNWTPGNAKYIVLWGSRSEPFSAPFMRVVVRCIGPLGGGKPRVRVDVVGEKK